LDIGAQIRKEAPGASKMAGIIEAADLYVSDFGVITLIPHPDGLSRDCIIVDPSTWAVATLRGMQARPLAKTGDSRPLHHHQGSGPGGAEKSPRSSSAAFSRRRNCP
jgi:hypothetical protein